MPPLESLRSLKNVKALTGFIWLVVVVKASVFVEPIQKSGPMGAKDESYFSNKLACFHLLAGNMTATEIKVLVCSILIR